MILSEYAKSSELEVRDNCVRAIESLTEQMAYNEKTHVENQAKLQARIDDCQATMTRIDNWLRENENKTEYVKMLSEPSA